MKAYAEPVIPTAFGSPQGVQVSTDRRLLSMSWTDADAGPVRLDQFDGRLDYAFAKTAPGVEFTKWQGHPPCGSTGRMRSSYSTPTGPAEPRPRASRGTR